MRGDVTDAGQTTNEQLKIELLSQWKLEAESRNIKYFFLSGKTGPGMCLLLKRATAGGVCFGSLPFN